MAKKIRKIDAKLSRIVAVIEGASDEMIGAAQDAAKFIEEINAKSHEINEQLGREEIVADEASARYQAEIVPLHARMENRLRRILKNNKAISGMMGAAKALYDADEEAAK